MPTETIRRSQNLPPCLPGMEGVHRYWDSRHEAFAAKLVPGDIYVTTQNELLVTTLGSCISVCVHDRLKKMGGMNHFLLPLQAVDAGSWGGCSSATSTRYGNWAMEFLINTLVSQGCKPRNMEFKVFGGGKIGSGRTEDVGQRNIGFVIDYLSTEGYPISSLDVGDIYPRKVHFFPESGRARVKKLQHLRNDTIFEREIAYSRHINEDDTDGSVELF